MRIVVGVACVLAIGCGGGTSGGGGPVAAIVNAPTQAALATYWQSSASTGCIVGHGPKGEQCAGPLNFALSGDGSAIWSTASYGYFGTSTWTQIGAQALLLNGLPFMPSSLNISAIAGAFSDGSFSGNASGYSDIVFTLQGGMPPGWTPQP